MRKRFSYDKFPSHLQLDPAKALCPCGSKAVAVWQEHPMGKHLGFECESGHLFDLDLKNITKDSPVIKTIYVDYPGYNMTEFKKQYKLPIKSISGMFFDARGYHILAIIDDKIEQHLLTLLMGGAAEITEIAFPVYYKNDPTRIYDNNHNEIISIRGWGRLQKLEGGAKIQDAIGAEIAELINKCGSIKNKTVNG